MICCAKRNSSLHSLFVIFFILTPKQADCLFKYKNDMFNSYCINSVKKKLIFYDLIWKMYFKLAALVTPLSTGMLYFHPVPMIFSFL